MSSPPPFPVGSHVNVARRMWPGINQPGGIAVVTSVGEGTVCVKYVIERRREADVPLRYVEGRDVINMSVGRGMEARGALGRCVVCGSLRRDCGDCEITGGEEVRWDVGRVRRSNRDRGRDKGKEGAGMLREDNEQGQRGQLKEGPSTADVLLRYKQLAQSNNPDDFLTESEYSYEGEEGGADGAGEDEGSESDDTAELLMRVGREGRRRIVIDDASDTDTDTDDQLSEEGGDDGSYGSDGFSYSTRDEDGAEGGQSQSPSMSQPLSSPQPPDSQPDAADGGSNFIQPEGTDVLHRLPADILNSDRVASLPYPSLIHFFDTEADRIENELIPDSNLALARALRDRAGLEEYNRMYDDLKSRLVNGGSDMIRYAQQRLEDPVERRPHRSAVKMTMVEVRGMRLDGLERQVEDIMRRVRGQIVSFGDAAGMSQTFGSVGDVDDVDDNFDNGDDNPMIVDFEGSQDEVDPQLRVLPEFDRHQHAVTVKNKNKNKRKSKNKNKNKSTRKRSTITTSNSTIRVVDRQMRQDRGVSSSITENIGHFANLTPRTTRKPRDRSQSSKKRRKKRARGAAKATREKEVTETLKNDSSDEEALLALEDPFEGSTSGSGPRGKRKRVISVAPSLLPRDEEIGGPGWEKPSNESFDPTARMETWIAANASADGGSMGDDCDNGGDADVEDAFDGDYTENVAHRSNSTLGGHNSGKESTRKRSESRIGTWNNDPNRSRIGGRSGGVSRTKNNLLSTTTIEIEDPEAPTAPHASEAIYLDLLNDDGPSLSPVDASFDQSCITSIDVSRYLGVLDSCFPQLTRARQSTKILVRLKHYALASTSASPPPTFDGSAILASLLTKFPLLKVMNVLPLSSTAVSSSDDIQNLFFALADATIVYFALSGTPIEPKLSKKFVSKVIKVLLDLFYADPSCFCRQLTHVHSESQSSSSSRLAPLLDSLSRLQPCLLDSFASILESSFSQPFDTSIFDDAFDSITVPSQTSRLSSFNNFIPRKEIQDVFTLFGIATRFHMIALRHSSPLTGKKIGHFTSSFVAANKLTPAWSILRMLIFSTAGILSTAFFDSSKTFDCKILHANPEHMRQCATELSWLSRMLDSNSLNSLPADENLLRSTMTSVLKLRHLAGDESFEKTFCFDTKSCKLHARTIFESTRSLCGSDAEVDSVSKRLSGIEKPTSCLDDFLPSSLLGKALFGLLVSYFKRMAGKAPRIKRAKAEIDSHEANALKTIDLMKCLDVHGAEHALRVLEHCAFVKLAMVHSCACSSDVDCTFDEISNIMTNPAVNSFPSIVNLKFKIISAKVFAVAASLHPVAAADCIRRLSCLLGDVSDMLASANQVEYAFNPLSFENDTNQEDEGASTTCLECCKGLAIIASLSADAIWASASAAAAKSDFSLLCDVLIAFAAPLQKAIMSVVRSMALEDAGDIALTSTLSCIKTLTSAILPQIAKKNDTVIEEEDEYGMVGNIDVDTIVRQNAIHSLSEPKALFDYLISLISDGKPSCQYSVHISASGNGVTNFGSSLIARHSAKLIACAVDLAGLQKQQSITWEGTFMPILSVKDDTHKSDDKEYCTGIQQALCCDLCFVGQVLGNETCQGVVKAAQKHMLKSCVSSLLDVKCLERFPTCDLDSIEELGGDRRKARERLLNVAKLAEKRKGQPDGDAAGIAGGYYSVAGGRGLVKRLWNFVIDLGKLIGMDEISEIASSYQNDDIAEAYTRGSLERECSKRSCILKVLVSRHDIVKEIGGSVIGLLVDMRNVVKGCEMLTTGYERGNAHGQNSAGHKIAQIKILKKAYCAMGLGTLCQMLRFVNPSDAVLGSVIKGVREGVVKSISSGAGITPGDKDKVWVDDDVRAGLMKHLVGVVVHCARGNIEVAESTMNLFNALMGLKEGVLVGRALGAGANDDEREKLKGLRDWILSKSIIRKLGYSGLSVSMRNSRLGLLREILQRSDASSDLFDIKGGYQGDGDTRLALIEGLMRSLTDVDSVGNSIECFTLLMGKHGCMEWAYAGQGSDRVKVRAAVKVVVNICECLSDGSERERKGFEAMNWGREDLLGDITGRRESAGGISTSNARIAWKQWLEHVDTSQWTSTQVNEKKFQSQSIGPTKRHCKNFLALYISLGM